MPRIISSDPSQYALVNANILPPSTISPYLGQGNGRTTTLSDFSSFQYPAAAPRQSISPNSHPNLDDHVSQYDMQASRHVYPLQMAQMPSTGFCSPDDCHSWTPLIPSNRQLYQLATCEGDISSNYATPAYHYSGITGASLPTITTESSSTFPGLSPLSTHLPYNGSHRTLPDPTSLHSSFDVVNGGVPEGDNGIGMMQQQSGKTKDPWHSNRLSSGTSQDSAIPIVRESIRVARPGSNAASSSPDDSTAFGYIPVTQSSSVQPDISASRYPSVSISAGLSDSRSSATSASQPPVLVNNGLALPDASLNMYGSPVSVTGSNSTTPEVSPSNSLAPSRILQPQPRSSSSYEVLRTSYDNNSQVTRKILKPSVDAGDVVAIP